MTSALLGLFLRLEFFISAWPRGLDGRGLAPWVFHLTRERLTPVGKTVAMMGLPLLVGAIMPGGTSAALVLLGLVGLVAASIVVTFRSPRMKATWQVPPIAVSGEVLRIPVKLHNIGTRRIREPAAWVFRGSDHFELRDGSASASPLDPGACVVAVPQVRPRRRGLARIVGPTLLASDPLGLARSRCNAGEVAFVAVAPRAPRLSGLRVLEEGRGGGLLRELASPWMGSGFEFSGVRPWAEGDSLRDLHHRAFARHGRPFVRERSRPQGDGLELRASTRAHGWGERALVEPLLSALLALAIELHHRGGLAGVRIDGVDVKVNRGLEPLREALAGLPVPGWGRWDRPEDEDLEPAAEGRAIVRMGINLERALHELDRSHSVVRRWIVIVAGSALTPWREGQLWTLGHRRTQKETDAW